MSTFVAAYQTEIVARTAAATRVDTGGRTRYRGRDKGVPSAVEQDLLDARLALSELDGAIEILAAAVTIESAKLRQTMRRDARAKIELAGRFVDEIVLRPMVMQLRSAARVAKAAQP